MNDSQVNRETLDRMVAELYHRLRRLAGAALRQRGARALVSPTELVHECYLQLAGRETLVEEDRNELLTLAARAIRGILVDHVRKAGALKRGGHQRRISLSVDLVSHSEEVDLVDLDVALEKLARIDERQARVVELRFFAGLKHPEIAQLLGCSPRTVNSEWAMAKAWLHRELERS